MCYVAFEMNHGFGISWHELPVSDPILNSSQILLWIFKLFVFDFDWLNSVYLTLYAWM